MQNPNILHDKTETINEIVIQFDATDNLLRLETIHLF